MRAMLAAALLPFLFLLSFAGAQNLDPFKQVKVDRLKTTHVPVGTHFHVYGDSTDIGAFWDTTAIYSSWKWTGINVTVVADVDCTAVTVIAECGNLLNTTYLWDHCDSTTIDEPGTHVWQVNLPVSQYVRFIFAPADTLTAARLDSCFINRNF